MEFDNILERKLERTIQQYKAGKLTSSDLLIEIQKCVFEMAESLGGNNVIINVLSEHLSMSDVDELQAMFP